MIKRKKEMQVDIRENMRDGEGKVEITHIFKKEELKGKARLHARVKLNPGCSIGMHEHSDEEEIYYILKGYGRADDNGTVVEIGPGDAILTGDGAYHSIENNGSEAMEFIATILIYN